MIPWLMFGRASVARRTEERRAEARRLEDVRRVAELTPGVSRRSCIAEVVDDHFRDDAEPAVEGVGDWRREEADDMERLAVLSDLVGPYEAARQIFGDRP